MRNKHLENERNPCRVWDLSDGEGVQQQVLVLWHCMRNWVRNENSNSYLRWTATVCEEGYSSLDMVLQKKNIKPIKMTNIASIFLSPSVEMPLITHL